MEKTYFCSHSCSSDSDMGAIDEDLRRMDLTAVAELDCAADADDDDDDGDANEEEEDDDDGEADVSKRAGADGVAGMVREIENWMRR
jgi:hypothetical protein